MSKIEVSESKLETLVANFYEACNLCDECDIYEHRELDDSMQEMKAWVNENFGRKLKQLK